MALKAHIFSNVSPADVPSRIPQEFHGLVDDSALHEASYTVIAFPGMRGSSTSIVDSKTLGKALMKCRGEDPGLIAVAHAFTAEAQQLLGERKVVMFQKSDFYWSDESWASIRDK